MSKSDYLKKYLSSNDINNEKKKKKSLSSTKTFNSSIISQNEREKKERKRGGGVIIIDNDIINDIPSIENIEEAWERTGQDDQPVIVELDNNNENISKGKWVPITLNLPKRKREDDNSPPRRRKEDSSPPRRKQVEENNSPPRRRKEELDSSPPRRKKQESSPPRRRQVEDDNSPPRRKKEELDNSSPRRKQVEDNSSPPRREKQEEESSPPRRKKVDNDNSPPRRKKQEEESSSPRRRKEESSPPRRKQVEDDSSPPRRKKDESPPRRKKEDNSPPRRSDNNKNDNELDSRGRMTKTASGHNAGLQSIESFGDKERELQKKREKELKELGNQEQEETIYRDKRGRKLDMLNEFMRQQATTEGKKAKIEQAQYEWGRGIVQKESQLEKQRELEIVASEPFARTADDPRLEEMRKQTIRDGDPMAEYITSKLAKQQDTNSSSNKSNSKTKLNHEKKKNSKPVYNGPCPTPNRFNIRPGYRWDAIDRGNGFENLLLKKISSKQSFKDDEYKWSVSDM